MSPAFEAYLATLYVDAGARRAFLADPRGAARTHGLAPAEVEALAAIDRVGLELAARSATAKRASAPPRRRWTLWSRGR